MDGDKGNHNAGQIRSQSMNQLEYDQNNESPFAYDNDQLVS